MITISAYIRRKAGKGIYISIKMSIQWPVLSSLVVHMLAASTSKAATSQNSLCFQNYEKEQLCGEAATSHCIFTNKN